MSAEPANMVVRCAAQPPRGWNLFLQRHGYAGFHLRSEWSNVFSEALGHRPWHIWCEVDGEIRGVLPLMHISGPIFGEFLVSQPYLNTGGAVADSPSVALALIGAAAELADRLEVKHLELRHEQAFEHPALNATNTEKLHMRLALPASGEALWDGLKSKLRSQLRKPLADDTLAVAYGREDQLDAFYRIFCRNMRDLGTPPFSKALFGKMLGAFPDMAEICTVTCRGEPIASGFLLHGPGATLIPSASSLREFNHTSCNMLMYWHALVRSIERGQSVFDFGRSSRESGTFKFKQQWGAQASPAVWQYRTRQGAASDMRPSSGKYDRVIALWQRLPVWVTRVIGPSIVRGIP